MGIAFFWFLFSIAVGIWAHNKGHTGFAWFLLALVISPLLGGIFCALSRDRKAVADLPSAATHVKCPACAEFVLPEASKCRHCGSQLVPKLNYVSDIQQERENASTIKAWSGIGVFAILCIAYFGSGK